ncbi:uncharacterized protein CTHT_0000430 [Thermochaetoides thermophila DSM 1495]|uniref:Uncharacterized protein n=1 Tax=Chaetomium thermophilum (strain DSM 1495 / CBS 144.50 / IMI 039719) TaxID=759272 RepID=G0RXU6_CHATD|nr:hypothetical protein CTHT_0000430 [Thermochaetoides thermophila DSM 1495]EGS24112.1 hypothetical protein CTHT_0000430 [Thermochaetoides thermophila DSM 1495]
MPFTLLSPSTSYRWVFTTIEFLFTVSISTLSGNNNWRDAEGEGDRKGTKNRHHQAEVRILQSEFVLTALLFVMTIP